MVCMAILGTSSGACGGRRKQGPAGDVPPRGRSWIVHRMEMLYHAEKWRRSIIDARNGGF
jgi:hypothetical protein